MLAPTFTLPNQNGDMISLEDYRGQKVVLYFYPKDATPGCTTEACDFRDATPRLNGAVVIGISADSQKKHQNFIAKHELPFDLLVDDTHEVSELYGVWQLKKNYGKEYYGIVRSTFLINEDGYIEQEWRSVKVNGHVDEVVAALTT
ncbi:MULTISPECIES: thioredoxin-dependent thiol peroxidase [unclassified Exiguobacterium]|uniref:thioredoxin-dependent thiol peroxidase n=1 Tax=unclassified Exiguobacterium TaxID=2644629 RepID=UPI00103A9016|nr:MULTISPECIES: thioredoxin-dependent thiol peroxidase [unclassified Exiguobacterium]TCI70255.1 thioredoxin-dependent thiol peroxidase [Exiguobacterium sp. IPCI3]TCI79285.1 thioredoxin-dependent thiol peroxidase [Exiguobacterium sp. IPCH1]TCI81761.1 thioredoxin-dependent thiol peroxidase [Exiguobacterium sp. IPBC4]